MGMIASSGKQAQQIQSFILFLRIARYLEIMEVEFMDTLALILSIIGSINWGLVGIFQFDLVAWIFGGQDALLSRIIYSVIGLAGLWCISLLFRRGRIGITDDE